MAAGKYSKNVRHDAVVRGPIVGFRFCVGDRAVADDAFAEVDTGAGVVKVVDVSSHLLRTDFPCWLGYKTKAVLPACHALSEIKNKMLAARGRRSKALWKGNATILDQEVRARLSRSLTKP